MKRPNILLGSIGRRVYLIEWFEAALEKAGVAGEVHVTDVDIHSSGMLHSKHAHRVPRYSAQNYEESLLALVKELEPTILLSVNDFELECWAEPALRAELSRYSDHILGLAPREQRVVSDKFWMADELRSHGITTPETVLASDKEGLRRLTGLHDRLVVKDRFGSGSSGLRIIDSSHLKQTVEDISSGKVGQGPSERQRGLDTTIVQPVVEGIEFGIDVVGPLSRTRQGCQERAWEFTRILARKKVRMRGGETDQARTVSAEPFLAVGRSLANLLRPEGIIDVDVIVDDDSHAHVIDINPRFGGGYPFNHLAGADVPYAIIAQSLGLASSHWISSLDYQSNLFGAKYQSVASSFSSLTNASDVERGRGLGEM